MLLPLFVRGMSWTWSTFAGACRGVMVAGRWVVRERHHAREEKAAERYARTLAQLVA